MSTLRSPIPVATRSEVWVYGWSLAGVSGSNPAGVMGCLCLMSVVCCQTEVSATGCSLVQRSPTKGLCNVECDVVATTVMRIRSTMAVDLWKKKMYSVILKDGPTS